MNYIVNLHGSTEEVIEDMLVNTVDKGVKYKYTHWPFIPKLYDLVGYDP